MLSGSQFDDWKQAYNLLGVPHAASPESIKQSYDRLAIRWHPDRYPAGTPAQAEASDMMKRIDAAYSRIAEAPLRFHDERHESNVALWTRSSSLPYSRPNSGADTIPEISPTFQRLIDYGTRFFFGALFGVAVAFGLITRFSRYGRYRHELSASGAVLLGVGAIVGCGLAAAFFGDNFWANVGRGRWLR